MRPVRAVVPVAAAALAVVMPACHPDRYVPGDHPQFPRIRFAADSQVTVNDRCPVRRKKLNRMVDPVYVNGRPVGFC